MACSMRLGLVALVALAGLQLFLSSRSVGCPSASIDTTINAETSMHAATSGLGAPAQRLLRLRRDGARRAASHAQLAPASLGNLRLNPAAQALFGAMDPATTPVIHFTFGSGAMLDFLRNWLHYVNRAGLAPAVAGAADAQMFKACTTEGIAALGIAEGLDVWTYTPSTNASTVHK